MCGATLGMDDTQINIDYRCSESQPEWMELEGGAVCYAPSRLGKLVLRITGFPRISQQVLQQNPEQFHRNGDSSLPNHHSETRHLYLGFHHPWDRDLWRGWLKHV
ncbi:hypothetical protein PV325_013395 [Microctonus aethiopoides]|nr:hypothetical protein PV325_013395 [Microctonus aethiopoides]KAK0097024.1 hypothetical protein PV326_003544 [Microctonus aethiopoides]